jgi:ABC-type Zn2+ transport system substrate-binding protein/surface adhesin
MLRLATPFLWVWVVFWLGEQMEAFMAMMCGCVDG